MALNTSTLQQARYKNTQHWDTRDVINYALACGYGQDGINPENLCYVYERDLAVVPSFATMIARNGTPSLTELGGDYSKSVLASVHASFHAPLPVSGSITVSTRVTGLVDKGADRGVLVGLETTLNHGSDCYATVATSLMARADGGYGSFGEVARSAPTPKTEPNQTHQLITRPDQAALYRLLGDINPLHIDPVAAVSAGFKQPIMHGLCTYGVACRGISEVFERSVASISARLSAPVYPGEILLLKIWHNDNSAHFELHAEARNQCVLSAGFITFED